MIEFRLSYAEAAFVLVIWAFAVPIGEAIAEAMVKAIRRKLG